MTDTDKLPNVNLPATNAPELQAAQAALTERAAFKRLRLSIDAEIAAATKEESEARAIYDQCEADCLLAIDDEQPAAAERAEVARASLAIAARKSARCEAVLRSLPVRFDASDAELAIAHAAFGAWLITVRRDAIDRYVAQVREATGVLSATLLQGSVLNALGFLHHTSLAECLIPHPDPRQGPILRGQCLRTEAGDTIALNLAWRDDPKSMELYRILAPLHDAAQALSAEMNDIQDQRDRALRAANQAGRDTDRGSRRPTRSGDELAAEHEAACAAEAARHPKFIPQSWTSSAVGRRLRYPKATSATQCKLA